MFVRLVAFFLLVWRASTQTANVIPSSLTGIEGENLNVTCSLEGGASMPVFELRVGGTPIQNTGKSQNGFATSTGTTFVYGPLSRTEVGLSFVCDSRTGFTASASLDVYCKFIVYFSALNGMIMCKMLLMPVPYISLHAEKCLIFPSFRGEVPYSSLHAEKCSTHAPCLAAHGSSSTVFMKFSTYWYVQYNQCLQTLIYNC